MTYYCLYVYVCVTYDLFLNLFGGGGELVWCAEDAAPAVRAAMQVRKFLARL
jgi:hypothetical protein